MGLGSNPDFSAIPILDYSLVSSSATRNQFLEQLRDALINVGFLYLSNHPISQTDIALLIDYIPEVFDLPQDAKEKISKIHSPHFLGYSRLGAELTKHVIDQREQFDFALGNPIYPLKEGDPEYYKYLLGPSQWPDEALVPGFRELFERYLKQVQDLGYAFSSLISESLGLGPNGFDRFFDPPELLQHRAKIVKYPVVEGSSSQGIGPHSDGGFLIFLLQASDQKGLQVQNLSGEWIDAPPIPGTLVVNIGRILEYVTQGLMRATVHQVISPTGSSPRYSVPFFHHVGINLNLSDHILALPQDDTRGKVPGSTDLLDVYKREPVGKATLIVRVRSHPDVGEKYYPALFKELFPNGLPGMQVS